MRIRWRGLELPTSVAFDRESLTESYGKFTAEPFERGFGTTIGNSLRRVLLSSLEGAAIASVKIEGVSHEFTAIEGVLEDVTEIVLNLKGVLVRMHGDEPKILTLAIERKGPVTGRDIQADPTVEIVNPDHHLFTLTKARSLRCELEVRKGRGYVTAEENQPLQKEIGHVPIDSIFSPVRRVRFRIEDTRVGQRTNYDRLLMEIWTNGVITPELAMVEASKILRKHLNPFVQYFELGQELQQERARQGEIHERLRERDELVKKLRMPVAELDLSVRASNCLNAEGVRTVGELVTRSEAEMLKIRNFGKTSLEEIRNKLTRLGLSFGMQLTPEEAAATGRG